MALGRIDVGVCYTRGASSRRWCGWRGTGAALRAGGQGDCSSGMDGSKKTMRPYPGRGNVCYSGEFRY